MSRCHPSHRQSQLTNLRDASGHRLSRQGARRQHSPGRTATSRGAILQSSWYQWIEVVELVDLDGAIRKTCDNLQLAAHRLNEVSKCGDVHVGSPLDL